MRRMENVLSKVLDAIDPRHHNSIVMKYFKGLWKT